MKLGFWIDPCSIRVHPWLAFLLLVPSPAYAQKKKADLKPPEPGYLFPPGGWAGTTLDVQVGLYDGTPDTDLFVLDSAAKLAPVGDLGPVLVPPPPYWFGAKSTLPPAPLPRERTARLTIPAGHPPGPVRWATGNANGAGSKTGVFWVGDGPEVTETPAGKEPQTLPALPVTVNGRLERIEEVDRYRLTAPRGGPVTCEVFARRLGVDVNATMTVTDSSGKVVADAVDTEGRDLAVTFRATAGETYSVKLHDLDFRGDRSFVYRLVVTPGPRVVAIIPAALKRGGARDVEFVGYGLATGGAALESVVRRVTVPADAKDAFAYRVETPWGTAPAFDIPLSDGVETVAGPDRTLAVPAAVTGVLDGPTAEAVFRVEGKKGDVWELATEARRFGSSLDLSLAVSGPDGKEIARNDDRPGTTDAGLSLTLPADGTYRVTVSDLSGTHGTRAAVYRLAVDRPTRGFTLSAAARLNVALGSTADLVVTATRTGGFSEPITVTMTGLPAGVGVPPNLVVPAGKGDLKIPLTAASDAPAAAGLVTVSATAGPITRSATVLVATTMAPRLKVTAVEADGGRKVHRGSTHPAEVVVERLDGFRGEVSLQMSAAQSYQRQGITGPDFVVPADADRAFYPCFMPEWLETTRTSRMELIGVVRVPDARGRVRHLVTPMAGRITMSIEGALLKVDATTRELTLRPGESAAVPVTVFRSAKLAGPVRLEVQPSDGSLAAEPVTVDPGRGTADVRVTRPKAGPPGEYVITVRGTAFQDGKYAVVSDTVVTVTCPEK